MKKYEFALVLQELTGKDESQAKKLVEKLVVEVKGKITESKVLGNKPLAYPIKKQTIGWYGIFVVELPEEGVSKLDQLVKLEEKILRYLIVRA